VGSSGDIVAPDDTILEWTEGTGFNPRALRICFLLASGRSLDPRKVPGRLRVTSWPDHIGKVGVIGGYSSLETHFYHLQVPGIFTRLMIEIEGAATRTQ
jgi:hypothetical protein